jgi:5-methylcytosine-specific restriction endonuclease McrA
MTLVAGEMKTCSKCGSEYPATKDFFYWRKDRGLQSVCKPCHISKVMETCGEWQRNNREKMHGYYAKYHAANKDRAHEYYLENKAKYDEQRRARREADPLGFRVRGNAYSRSWRKRNPEAVKQSWARWYSENREYEATRQENKRARRMNATGSFSEDDVRFIHDYQDGRCFYCLEPVGDGFHRDHFVPLAKGGTNDWTNIVVSCPSCNFSKKDKLPEDYLAEHRRY